jgi:hypothetical protein
MKRERVIKLLSAVVIFFVALGCPPVESARTTTGPKVKARASAGRAGKAPATLTPAVAPALEKAYKDAVEDAKRADPSEVSQSLTPITEANKDLMWKNIESRGVEGRGVLVVTWVNDASFKRFYEGKKFVKLPAGAEMWVTAAPQVKDFCKGISTDKLTLRLEQLLGLPPNNGKTRFMELWVHREDLIRPSPDPEIIDREAISDEIDPWRYRSTYYEIHSDYKHWYDNQKKKSYRPANEINDPNALGQKYGFPWTRLGYTYDWASDPNGDPKQKVGLSEFLILGGKDFYGRDVHVHIKDSWPTEKYCSGQ